MVGTTMTIEREIKDARSIQDASDSGKRRESQSSSSLGKKPRASNLRGFQSHDHLGQGQIMVPSQTGQTLCYLYHQWGRLGHSLFLHPQYGSKESISVPRCCTRTSYYTYGLERPEYRSRSRTSLTGRDIRDSMACLRHHTTGSASGFASHTGYIFAISLMGKSIVRFWCIAFIHRCIMCVRTWRLRPWRSPCM